jgi:hypothetical protein
MSVAARRYLPHLTALLTLTLIPVGMHSYANFRTDDCEHPTALAPRAGAPSSYLNERFQPAQWRSGKVRIADSGTLDYVILRSFDPKLVYYRPEYHLFRATRPSGGGVEWIEIDGDEKMPVHRPQYRREQVSMVPISGYVLIYGGRLVDNPYLTHALSAPLRILGGQQPMTLYFISGMVPPAAYDRAQERMHEWLRESWLSYERICGS